MGMFHERKWSYQRSLDGVRPVNTMGSDGVPATAEDVGSSEPLPIDWGDVGGTAK